MTPLRLSGTWRLVSFDIINPNGERLPWGRAMHGTLIYSADDHSGEDMDEIIERGWMSASINRAVEPESSELPEGILDSCLFYSGRYELHPGEVRHFDRGDRSSSDRTDIDPLTGMGWGHLETDQSDSAVGHGSDLLAKARLV